MRFLPFLVVSLLSVCLDGPTPVRAGTFGLGGPQAGQVEATFMVKLFKYVEWPHAENSAKTPTICFLPYSVNGVKKPSAVQRRLETALERGESWTHLRDGRTVHVTVLSTPSELTDIEQGRACQILYLDSPATDQWWPFQVPPAVLTVSSKKDFAFKMGGMFQFIWNSDNYQIAMNPPPVLASGVEVDGSIESLCDRVDDARFRR